jgi:hypothetical protein
LACHWIDMPTVSESIEGLLDLLTQGNACLPLILAD